VAHLVDWDVEGSVEVVSGVSEEDTLRRVVAEISLIRNCTPTIMVLTNRVPLMAAVVGDTVVALDLGVVVVVAEVVEVVLVVAALMLKESRANRSWSAT